MARNPDHSAAASGAGSGGDVLERAVDGAIRLGRAWKALSPERRMAAIAAAILWLTLFLPWYQASVVTRSGKGHAVPVSQSLSGWAAFGAVEALILLLSLGLLVLLFLRAEDRVSQLPGGDGWTVTAIGAVCVFLVILGIFNVPSPASHGEYVLSTGVEWGIFIALLAAGGLTWAGGRIRLSLADDPFLAQNLRRGSASPSEAPPAKPRSKQAPSPGPDDGSAGVEPLTAAATQVTPERQKPDAPSPDREKPGGDPPAPRSSWRPAERPAWSDPERPVGWLTAGPKRQDEDESGPDEEEATRADQEEATRAADQEEATRAEETSRSVPGQEPPEAATTLKEPGAPAAPAPHRAPAPKPDTDQLTIPLDHDE